MKRFCLLLALLLLLSGCSKGAQSPIPTPRPTENTEPEASVPTEAVTEPETATVSFDIFAINDLHGKLADTDTQPGVDELSTYLKNAQSAGNTILLATGDMWQGASESNLTGGFMMTEWMNALRFTAMTMGGHEFDWGEEQIRKNQALADFPFLAINIYSRETGKQVDYCQSSVTVEADGVQIGIIGAIGNCYNSISPENTQGVSFKTGSELTALVKAESEKLRSQGVDFIIYAIHDGYDKNSPGESAMSISDEELGSYYDISLSDGYVDLVFEADTHYAYTLRDRHGVFHLQAGGNNSAISHARVVIDPKTGKSAVHIAQRISSGQYSLSADDPIVETLLNKYQAQIAPSDEILGVNSQYRSGNMVCDLVAKLYCTKGAEKWGNTYDIVLGGGYLSCRSPGYLPKGEVSYSQLQSLLPFDNQIMLCSIRGRDLISKFLETDNKAYHIKLSDYGNTVKDSIDPNGIYYVVTDSYTAHYAYNNMTVIDTYAPDIFARDLLADYIRSGNMQY